MKLFSTLKMLATITTLALVLAGTSVRAGFQLVTSRSALAGNDSLDWATLGLSSNTGVFNPFAITSTNGVTATVNGVGSDGFFRNYTPGVNGFPPYWEGNFAANAPLLGTFFHTITISLPTPIFGGGAQIENNGAGNFTAVITALDASSNVLASFTEAGQSTNAADNSAIFIGILSDTANISQIQFQMATGNSFAINQFDFRTIPEVSGVPEPASLTLLGLGTIGFVGYARRRRILAVS